MWYLIKQTVKDPANPSVIRVQRVVNGEVNEYIVLNIFQHDMRDSLYSCSQRSNNEVPPWRTVEILVR
jgi:hypothetical protein